MIDYVRVKSPWSQLGLFFGLLGVLILLTWMLSAVVLLSSGYSGRDWAQPGFISVMKILQAVSSITMFFLPAYFFARISFRQRPLFHLGLRPASRWQMYSLAILCMLVSFPLVSFLGDVNHAIPLPEWMVQLEKDTSKQMVAFLKADRIGDILINVVVMAFLPAFGEEICFRGALQRILINITRGPWTGIVVTAILFSALHFQFLGFLPRVFLGILLGAIYWYSGSLWASILAHCVYNGVQVVGVAYAPEYIDKNPEIPVLFSVVSTIAVMVVLWLMRSQSTITYAKVYEPGAPDDRFIA